MLVLRLISIFSLVVVCTVACQDGSFELSQDKPVGGFPVLAVFLGCQSLPAGIELPRCPPDSLRSCRERFYWCHRQDGTWHGPWIRLFPNGQLSLLIEYRDGERHGSWSQWYQNGKKWKEGTYHRGKEHSDWNGWYRNGRQSYHHEYSEGVPTGHWTHWDESGIKVDEARY